MIGACSLIQRDPISAGLRRKPRNHPALPYISRPAAPQPPSLRPGGDGGVKGVLTAPPPPTYNPQGYLQPHHHLPNAVTIPPAPGGHVAAATTSCFTGASVSPPLPRNRGWAGAGSRAGGRSWPPHPPPAHILGTDQPLTPRVTQGHVATLLQ